MTTRRKPGKQDRSKRLPRASEVLDGELALAEELLRVSRKEQADLVAGWEKFLKQLGIHGKPIGAKELRAQLLNRGFDAESREFSKGIIAMREE